MMSFMTPRGDSQVAMQAILLQHIEDQKSSLNHLTNAIDAIKSELHMTNKTIAEQLSANQLQLIETKTEILNAVLEKFVEKEDYATDLLQREKQMARFEKALDSKVDKGTVRVLWATLSSVAAGGAFYITEKGG